MAVQKTDINPQTGKAWAVNPATGVWDDNYWALQVEPQLKQPGGPNYVDPVEQLIRTTQDNISKRHEEFMKKSKEFDTKNPFTFDDFLAEERTKIKQRLDPYYEQTLGDYLQGVNIKRSRSLEDERTLLSELNQDVDMVVGEEKQRLTDAIERSREGYVDAGLYTSGARLREQGREETQTGKNLADTLTKQQRAEQQITTGTTRLGQDLALEEKIKRRDLGVEQEDTTRAQATASARGREAQQRIEKGEFTGPDPTANPDTWQQGLYSMLGA